MSRAALLAAAVSVLVGVSAYLQWNAQTAMAASQPNSADRVIFWIHCSELPQLSDAQLDLWKSRGVDGFACMMGHLRGLGGSQDFTGDPHASLTGSNFDYQRSLRDSDVVGRMRARGMKAYIGVYLVNYWNRRTPLAEWFDDSGWSQAVLPKMADLAAAAKQLGFAGLAFDQELYPQEGGVMGASWDWHYPGNSHSEAQVRAMAGQRGRELMGALVRSFPGVELLAYDVELPETWGEVVQREVNGTPNAYAPRLDIDFWDGLSSVEGYRAIRLLDAMFYKTAHIAPWDRAFQYNYNKLYAYLSRRLSNWSYASSRLSVSPFAWIDRGPCGCYFQEPRPPEYVAEQLAAFRKWGMGGEFANYASQGLGGFDYTPYLDAMRFASAPAAVDTEPPTLTIDRRSPTLEGTAHDNLAIRSIRWQDDQGDSGVARLNWDVVSGDYRSGYVGRTSWQASGLPLQPAGSKVTVTAEDIKGLTTTTETTLIDPPRAPQVSQVNGASATQVVKSKKKQSKKKQSKKKRSKKKRHCAKPRSRRSKLRRRSRARRCVARVGGGHRGQARRKRRAVSRQHGRGSRPSTRTRPTTQH